MVNVRIGIHSDSAPDLVVEARCSVTGGKLEGQNIIPQFAENLSWTLRGEAHPGGPLTLGIGKGS